MEINKRVRPSLSATARALLAAIAVASLCTAAFAQVKIDLLEGWGAFETSNVTEWESYYSLPTPDPTDYDFDTNSLYYTKSITADSAYREGVKAASADDTVAIGWRRITNANVNPGAHIVYNLSPSGIGGSNCQYLALKNLPAGRFAVAGVESIRQPFTKMHAALTAGDEVVFKIDHIRMSDFASLSNGGYYMWIQWNTGAATHLLTPSETAFSDEMVATIPSDATFVSGKVIIRGNVAPGTQPGIYVDGAHLFIRHASSTARETHESPLPRNRAIKTFTIRKHIYDEDTLSMATEFDSVVMGLPQDYAWATQLKALNPDIKLFLYLNSRTHKAGDKDPYYGLCPMGYYYISSTHPEWLIERTPGVPGDYAFSPDFPWEYWTRLADTNFETAWAEKARDRVAGAKSHGVLVDNLNVSLPGTDSQGKITSPQIDAWEVQKFLRRVVTTFSAAGSEVMGNACGFSLSSGLGTALFYPFWTPVAPYTSSEYTANTPSTTARHILQEWSFVRPLGYNRLDYNKEFWKLCLDNMDAVKQWNTDTGEKQLAPSQQRWLYVYEDIFYENHEAVYGRDGWRHFGLCSYLLAQNPWTLFGWGVVPSNDVEVLDLSATLSLGEALGEHLPYNGDEYCRYRKYGPSVAGAAGGLVVVNANPDATRTFTLDFDGIDEFGTTVSAGQAVVLQPHTGRMFLKQKGPVFVRVRTPSSTVTSGNLVTITVDYLNSSASNAMDVQVRAKVPSEMTYLAGSAEMSGGSYDAASGIVYWKIGTVAAGSSGRRTFQARVK